MNKMYPATASCLSLFVTLLCCATQASAQQQLSFTPFHSTGIYQLGEMAGWNVAATPQASCRHYTYTVKQNNSTALKTGQLDLTSGKAEIEVRGEQPGILHVEVLADCPTTLAEPSTVIGKEGSPALEATLGAAIAPAELKPVLPPPADFDAFWSGKLKQLERIPIDPQLTPVASGNPDVDLYLIKLRSMDSHVQGYLAVPKKAGKHPALILYQYAGVYALNSAESVKYAAQGWLTFDVDSHDISPTGATGISKQYAGIGRDSRETSYFLDMYLRDTRAVDYIYSRKDWDGKTLAVNGVSMGGMQSLATAGLNPKRVTAVIVGEPAGAEINGDMYGRRAGFPRWPSDDAKAMETSRYFDTVNFAPRIKAPTIIAVGFIDPAAPPVGVWTEFNVLSGPKEIIPMIHASHVNLTPRLVLKYFVHAAHALDILLHGGELHLTGGITDEPPG